MISPEAFGRRSLLIGARSIDAPKSPELTLGARQRGILARTGHTPTRFHGERSEFHELFRLEKNIVLVFEYADTNLTVTSILSRP